MAGGFDPNSLTWTYDNGWGQQATDDFSGDVNDLTAKLTQAGMSPDAARARAIKFYTDASNAGYDPRQARGSLNNWFDKTFGGGSAEDKMVKEAQQQKQASDEQAAGAASAAEMNGVRDRIQKFADSLGVADPAVMDYLHRMGQAQAGQAQSQAGIWGANAGNSGLGATGEAAISADLQNKYNLQRNSMQQSALGLLSQHDLGVGQLQLSYDQLRQQQANQQWAAQQNQAQGWGSAIGGALGALGFAGGPVLGAATMKAGSSIGAGIGGLTAGNSSPYTVQTPNYGGGWGGNRGSYGGSGF